MSVPDIVQQTRRTLGRAVRKGSDSPLSTASDLKARCSDISTGAAIIAELACMAIVDGLLTRLLMALCNTRQLHVLRTLLCGFSQHLDAELLHLTRTSESQ